MVYLNELEPANGLKTSNTTWNIKVYSGRDVYVYKTPISMYDVFYRIIDGNKEIYPTQKDLENGEWAWKCKTIDGAVKSLNIRGFNVKKKDFTSGELYFWSDLTRLRDDRDKLKEEVKNGGFNKDYKSYLYSKINVYDKVIEEMEDNKKKNEEDPRSIFHRMPTLGEGSVSDEAANNRKEFV